MIEGRVAAILNSRELVLNRGSADGVRDGMTFEVLEPAGRDVKDPETGEILGSVQRPKVKVRTVHVQERLTIARTFESWRENIGGSGVYLPSDVIARALTPPKYVTRHRTLKSAEQTWEPLDESESVVKVGDPVREVVEDQDDS